LALAVTTPWRSRTEDELLSQEPILSESCLGRKRTAQHHSQPDARIAFGETIATDCLNCQSPLECQPAKYRLE
jgi:hypothetical protein